MFLYCLFCIAAGYAAGLIAGCLIGGSWRKLKLGWFGEWWDDWTRFSMVAELPHSAWAWLLEDVFLIFPRWLMGWWQTFCAMLGALPTYVKSVWEYMLENWKRSEPGDE